MPVVSELEVRELAGAGGAGPASRTDSRRRADPQDPALARDLSACPLESVLGGSSGAGGGGAAALLLPSAAEAPSEGRTDDCYQLPIAREDIRFLASWEDLARHEAELLQVGPGSWGGWLRGLLAKASQSSATRGTPA